MNRNTNTTCLFSSKNEREVVTQVNGSKKYKFNNKSRRKCEEHLHEVFLLRPETYLSFVIIEIDQLSLSQLSLHTFYLFFPSIRTLKAPLQFLDVFDDLRDRVMVFHHFLVMTAALVSRPTLDHLAHHDIYL